MGVPVAPVTGIPADGVPVLAAAGVPVAAAIGVLVSSGAEVPVLAGKVLAGKVLPATGVPVVTAPGVPDVPPVGAQAARARDKTTKKVPIRVTRFNFCCFIIKPPFEPPNQGDMKLTLVLYSKGKFALQLPRSTGTILILRGPPLLY
jgi:hypothetical protein